MGYQRTTSCTHSVSFQYVMCVVMHLVELLLYGCLLLRFMLGLEWGVQKQVMMVMGCVSGVVWGLMLYDFVGVSCSDPVDEVVVRPRLRHEYPEWEISKCEVCGWRHVSSRHCSRCGRCTRGLDHHSKFLNNCIGRGNYENFLRLVILMMFEHVLCLGQTVAVFVLGDWKYEDVSGWLLGVLGLISTLLFVFTVFMLQHHCLFPCCLGQGALQSIFEDSEAISSNSVMSERSRKSQKVQTQRKITS